MQYKNFTKDFAERTWSNLETIRKIEKSQNELSTFEVTQLINSFLGLVVFPIEAVNKGETVPLCISEKLWTEIGTPEIDSYKNSTGSFDEMLEHFRNAVAHRRIKCFSEHNIIVSIQFEDQKYDKETRRMQEYRKKLKIEQLEKLTEELYQAIVSQGK